MKAEVRVRSRGRAQLRRALFVAAMWAAFGAVALWAGGEKHVIATAVTAPGTAAPATDVYLGTLQFSLNKSATASYLTAITLTHYGSASAGSITDVKLFQDGDSNPGNGGMTQYGSTVASLSGSSASFSDPSLIFAAGTTPMYAHLFATVSTGATSQTVGFQISSASSVTWSLGYSDGTTYPVQLGTTTIQSTNLPPAATITTPVNGGSIGGPGPYSVTGTASDSDGTVTAVDVQISRNGGAEYWGGSAWNGSASTWLPASGTTSWSYSWAWTTDMEGAPVSVTARATDDAAATGSDTNTATVDSLAPRIATGVRFQTLPTSGNPSFTLLSDWTEANPGTPQFAYFLNGGPYTGWTDGAAGNASTYTAAVALDGADWFQGIRSRHADAWGNGPTPSEDSGPIFVLPLTPSAPTVANNGTQASLNVAIVANPSEDGSGMLYAVRCHDAGGTPTGFWVADSGRQCTAGAPDWRTAATWGSPIVVGGLSAGTQYAFSVAAGNPNDATPTTGERSASAYGGTASATTSSGNTPPSVSITSPSSGASFSQGASVSFAGTASDAEDGNLTASLSWTSSIDGPIGSGGAFARSDLAVGTHTITAAVTDSGSLSGQDQISITINAVVNAVTPGTPTATIDSCNQITVQAPFSGDSNGNSTTLVERSPNGTDGWTTVTGCAAVGGASPRVCVDTTVADNSTNYYRIDFSDGDGVSGTDPQVIGPFDTVPYCGVDGTTVEAPEAEGSSCAQITVLARFGGDSNQNGWTQVESSPAGAGTWTVACARLTGPSPRQCVVAQLAESTAYDLRIDYTDADGVADGGGTDPQTVAGVSTRACGGDGVAPTVLILAPTRGGVVTGTDRVKVQVHDAVGVSSVQWSVDQAGDTGLAAASANGNYDCGAGCAVYEFDLSASALAVGDHYLTIKASDAAGNVARVSRGFRVNSAGGDGRLLRRTRGAQLCIDCHNLKTHSSQATSSKYGTWAIGCDTCHTPHRTRNLYLVREEVETPSSGQRPVRFEARTGAVANSTAAGSASYANEDNATQSDGPCQVCHTRTKSAGGAARWRNADAGGNADSHYASAATSACMGCHTHDAGFSGAGGACDSCHDAPPTIGKHGRHDEVGTLPTAYDGLTATTTATQYGFACAKCHGGTHFSDSSTPHTVEVAFDATVEPKNPAATYTPDAGSQATDPGNNGDGWYWSNGTCANVYCHSDADRLGGIAYQSPAPRWDQAAALTCVSCHDDGGADSTLSGAHVKHTTAATYDFGCVRCHDATLDTGINDIAPAAVADKTKHVDGARTVVFDPSGPNNSGGTYSQDPGYTCSNTYCHSNGQDKVAPYGSGASIAWNATAAADCTSCHGGNATAGTKITSGRHAAHTDNAGVLGTNYQCAACHSATVAVGNDRAITGFAAHVNQVANVSGTLTDNSYASPTCNNAYCHSSGQATPESYSPVWTSGSLDCKGCHGNHSTPAFTSQFGEPNYANGGAGAATANSHVTHVSIVTDCAKCHNDTTTSGVAILGGSTLHTNQTREVRIAAAYDSNGGTKADNYTPGTKTCGSVSCHGGSGSSVVWGATLVCLSCHSGTEGGALGDGTPNAVDDQWTQGTSGGGHGGSRGGSLSSALGGCDYCHQLNAAHTPTAAANPYRLRFSATDNTLCLQCHAAGDPGISQNSAGTGLTAEDSTLEVDTAHYGAKHAAGEGGQLCWDCHDPHGVPSNILMVKPQVSKTSSSYGVPSATVTVAFTARAAASDFVKSTGSPRQGMCQACHDPSGQGVSGPTKYWRSDGTDDPDGPGGSAPVTSVHNASTVCTSCHAHTDDFKGAGGGPDCRGCHDDGEGSRRAIVNDFANGSSPDFRSHHVGNGLSMGGSLTNYDCVVCHAEGKVQPGAGGDCPDATGQTTCTDPTYHANGTFDLRDVDSASAAYEYDKDAVATSAGAAGNWNSGNQLWREWTSGVDEGSGIPANAGLDRFCVGCHDADGASQIANFRLDATQTALNPFADTTITNNYDQANRTRVVDIASRVSVTARTAAGGYVTATDRDSGYAPSGVLVRGADGRADPPEGVFSRHAIRGMSGSTYGATNANWDTATYWVGTWSSTSVMGCADCHTVDGANTTSGNAHGSASEYLQKDRTGTATEGRLGTRTATGSYICYACHSVSHYDPEGGAYGHTGNAQDQQEYSGAVGSARIPSGNTGGNVYGYACGNCHGGGPPNKSGATFPTGSTGASGFGTIHGTSQVLGIASATGTARPAYRFTNGNSMRYYNPGDWTSTAARSCYTIGSADTWGGCTKHSGSAGAQDITTSKQRPLNY